MMDDYDTQKHAHQKFNRLMDHTGDGCYSATGGSRQYPNDQPLFADNVGGCRLL